MILFIMSSASLLQCPLVFWPESKCYQEHYRRLYTDPFDENVKINHGRKDYCRMNVFSDAVNS